MKRQVSKRFGYKTIGTRKDYALTHTRATQVRVSGDEYEQPGGVRRTLNKTDLMLRKVKVLTDTRVLSGGTCESSNGGEFRVFKRIFYSHTRAHSKCVSALPLHSPPVQLPVFRSEPSQNLP